MCVCRFTTAGSRIGLAGTPGLPARCANLGGIHRGERTSFCSYRLIINRFIDTCSLCPWTNIFHMPMELSSWISLKPCVWPSVLTVPGESPHQLGPSCWEAGEMTSNSCLWQVFDRQALHPGNPHARPDERPSRLAFRTTGRSEPTTSTEVDLPECISRPSASLEARACRPQGFWGVGRCLLPASSFLPERFLQIPCLSPCRLSISSKSLHCPPFPWSSRRQSTVC